MRDSGIESIDDLRAIYQHLCHPGARYGNHVAMDGHRPLMTEVQALVSTSGGGSPRRVVTGLVQSRLNTVVAILSRHFNRYDQPGRLRLHGQGITCTNQPPTSLLAAAILSSRSDTPLPRSTSGDRRDFTSRRTPPRNRYGTPPQRSLPTGIQTRHRAKRKRTNHPARHACSPNRFASDAMTALSTRPSGHHRDHQPVRNSPTSSNSVPTTCGKTSPLQGRT